MVCFHSADSVGHAMARLNKYADRGAPKQTLLSFANMERSIEAMGWSLLLPLLICITDQPCCFAHVTRIKTIGLICGTIVSGQVFRNGPSQPVVCVFSLGA